MATEVLMPKLGLTMDFTPVRELCAGLDIPYTCLKTDIKEIVFDVRKEDNPCSLCAKMRRGAINDAILENGFDKLALGHHFDDAVETFVMSLLYEGRISCFRPVTYMPRRGPGGAIGPKPRIENPGRMFRRVLGYVTGYYGLPFALVFVCICVTVLASIKGTLFMRTLIDNYITPLTKTVRAGGTADYSGLTRAIGVIVAYYACGVLASFVQSRLMIYIAQGTLYRLRRDLFTHMSQVLFFLMQEMVTFRGVEAATWPAVLMTQP